MKDRLLYSVEVFPGDRVRMWMCRDECKSKKEAIKKYNDYIGNGQVTRILVTRLKKSNKHRVITYSDKVLITNKLYYHINGRTTGYRRNS